MTRVNAGRVLALLVAVAMGYLALAPSALAVTRTEVKAMIEKRFGVEVLRIKEISADGQEAYAVTVMNPGGNFNEAFQVNTIVVDRKTGRLIPQFRHRAAGVDRAAGGGRNVPEDTGPLSRRLLGR
jgi:ribosomal protein L23